MVRGWFMPVGASKFHWFSGDGRRLLSACRRHYAHASEILGCVTKRGPDDCLNCVKAFNKEATHDA